jgi:RNA polymerase sigma factor (sigma-70 family)
MADRPETDSREPASSGVGEAVSMDTLKAWFVREVLPLEAVLIQFLSRGGRSKSDVEDLRQELYMKVCLAAQNEFPKTTRPFVFKIARNLLVDRVRHESVVPFDTVENLEELNVAIDEPAPDRVVIARQELRRLQLVLETLPERFRDAIVMRKVDGLSVREIAARTGAAEKTIEEHITKGMRALADALYREADDFRGVS